MASNASLRRSNAELASQLEELKFRNEELSSNHVGLIEENARIISQLDGMKVELEKEKAVSSGLIRARDGCTESENNCCGCHAQC